MIDDVIKKEKTEDEFWKVCKEMRNSTPTI